MHPCLHRIKFLFCKKEELYSSLKEMLGFAPNHLSFYKEALLHKSLKKKDPQGKALNNERLEYLGDAIIEAVVSDIVFHRFPNAREGFLTTTRSKLVKRETLNSLALKIGLDHLVQYHSYSESHNSHINGNAFEALIGAIYLDQGYRRCYQFIHNLIEKGLIKPEAMAKKENDFKSHLLEWCQRNRMRIQFDSISSDTPDKPTFFTQVIIEGMQLGKGTGYTKKESHQHAADKTINILRHQKHIRPALIRRHKMRLVIQDMLDFLPQFEQLQDSPKRFPSEESF